MANSINFLSNDCALISIATGQKAMTLAELRNTLTLVPLDRVYHHFWGDLLVPLLSTSSIFYHFINACCRLDQGCDEFSPWLDDLADEHLGRCKQLATIDPYSPSLSQPRSELATLGKGCFAGGSA
jgi:hypothetical protein